MDKNYLEVMMQSLQKKIQILDAILEKSRQQQHDLQDPQLTVEAFETLADEKAKLIEALSRLDNGFQSVFNKIQEQLEQGREQYKPQIQVMQKQIKEIMEKSNEIQTIEARNKQLAQQKFANVRSKVKQIRSSQKVVNQYYQNMMKVNNIDPQFMDRKK